MNDDELLTMVSEQRTKVPMTVPVEQIIGRGRAVRARRRISGMAGALAIAAGAALAVTSLVPSSHPANRQSTAHLTAWTVSRQANGDIHVTIHQLRDPAGLQRTLRADGLPVNVNFTGPPLSTSCQPYSGSGGLLRAVAQFHAGSSGEVLAIDPSALPRGIGISIFERPGVHTRPHPLHQQGGGVSVSFPLAIGLVQASQQCTG